MMPLPTVFATAVPIMAPMTFIVAAMRSAARGVHARVDTGGRDRVRRVVEAVRVAEEQRDGDDDADEDQIQIHGSGFLQCEGLDDVSQLLEGVGAGLEALDDVLELDDRDRVQARVEQSRQSAAVGQVALVLEAVDLDPVVAQVHRRLQLVHVLRGHLRAVLDDLDLRVEQRDQGRGDVGNAVDDQEVAGFVDEVEAVVQVGGQRLQVFAVERRDERGVDALNDRVVQFVAAVLDLVELIAQGRCAPRGEAA